VFESLRNWVVCEIVGVGVWWFISSANFGLKNDNVSQRQHSLRRSSHSHPQRNTDKKEHFVFVKHGIFAQQVKLLFIIHTLLHIVLVRLQNSIEGGICCNCIVMKIKYSFVTNIDEKILRRYSAIICFLKNC